MEMKRLGTGLAAKLQSRRVETEAQAVTGSTESNGGFIRKAGIIALGTIALAGAAAAAVPATTEAYEEAPNAGVELVAYRGGHHFGGYGYSGGGNGGAFLWGFGLGMLTNPCIWNYCGPVYPQYPPVQMRGPWHYGPTNPNPWGEWHFHDNMGHYYGG